eukprot:jgi/Botrbrau1/4926/Bobra.0122s0008.1
MQMDPMQMTRSVHTLGYFIPTGLNAIDDEEHHANAGGPARIILFGGNSGILGPDSFDEEFYISGNKLVWSASGMVRKRLTLDTPILDAVWCRFGAAGGSPPVLCLLEHMSLTTYTVDGETLSMCLPQPFTHLWPLTSGLLLTGGKSTVPHVLLHPLENVEAVQLAEGGTAAGETIVWTSLELPYLASYNEDKRRLRLWQTQVVKPVLPPMAAYNPHFPRTPPILAARPGGPDAAAAAAPPAVPKRVPLRDAYGNLSPAAFSAVRQTPRTVAETPLEVDIYAALPLSDPTISLSPIWEQPVSYGCPQALLTSDEDGAALLVLLYKAAQRVIGLRLPTKPPNPSGRRTAFHHSFKVAFDKPLEFAAAVAVVATRSPPAGEGRGSPCGTSLYSIPMGG